MSIAALAVAVALALNFVDVPMPACNFHRLTGYPCPGCGGTRASLLLSRMDVGGAIEMNPLVAVLGITCGLAAVYSIIVLTFRLQRIRFRFSSNRERLASWITFTLIALVNWAYLIAIGR